MMRLIVPLQIRAGMALPVAGLALAAWTLFDPVATSAATKCPIDGRAVHVTLDVISSDTVWRTSHGRSDLKRLARKVISPRASQGHPLGLTVSEFNQLMNIEVALTAVGRNRFCAVPTRVKARIGYPEFATYIDHRYKAGTCQYRQIKIHELRHVDIYRRHLRHFAPLVRSRLKEAAARIKPVFVKNPAAASGLVLKRLSARIKPIVDQLNRATSTDHGRIDSPDSYAGIQKRCRSW